MVISQGLLPIQTKRVPPPANENTADCFDTETRVNYLSYYPQYSYNGCAQECQANFTIHRCGCRSVFEPGQYFVRVTLMLLWKYNAI